MYVVAPFIIAVLAIWLGVTVMTRTAREYPSHIFGVITVLLTLYGLARMIVSLTGDPAVRDGAVRLEFGINSLLPAALLHIALALTSGQRRTSTERVALLGAYGAGLIMGAAFAISGRAGLSVMSGRPTLLGLPEAVLALGWVALRLAIMLAAMLIALRAWQRAPHGSVRRRQFGAVFAAVGLGAIGGVLTIGLAQLRGPEWPGLALVAVSLGLAAYGVIVRNIFLAPEAARRSLVSSIVAGLLIAGYVGALLGVEWVARRVLHVEAPLFLALALVLTVAAFDPLRERMRRILDLHVAGSEPRQRRLLRALGDELLTSQRPDAALTPALDQLATTIDMSAAAIVGADGRVLAAYGVLDERDRPVACDLALRVGAREYGTLRGGAKRSGGAYSASEMGLLEQAATFFAAALHLSDRQAAEAAALETLSQERATFQAQETALAIALNDSGAVQPPRDGLHVYALGPLRVERGGEAIQRWGGAKAGTRQAQAVFAFLFDRGEHGVAKDEFVELLWPDTPLDKADLAFHRTLGGLRRMLEPDLRRAADSTAIAYRNDRYYLDPGLVAWSDTAQFEQHIGAARGVRGEAKAAALEAARALWRGDYLEDCPFYGDSAFVEERRRQLRGRYIDVLLALGEHYEQTEPAAAAASFREALRIAGDDCPRADDGLARLGLPLLDS